MSRSSRISHQTVYPRVCGGTGNVVRDVNRSRGGRVYPRVCGGTSRRSIGMTSEIMSPGLSPRVRGNPSLFAMMLTNRLQVYPRVCGGTAILDTAIGPNWSSGLSPRVRGNHCQGIHAVRAEIMPVYPRVCGGTHVLPTWTPSTPANGSIPACAGEPAMPVQVVSRHNDVMVYPRVCGGTPLTFES